MASATASVKLILDRYKPDVVKTNVASMLDALDLYYNEHCSGGANPTPTVAVLLTMGYLTSASLLENPLGNRLVPSVLWGTPDRLRVSATITAPGTITTFENRLGASSSAGNVLHFDRLPWSTGNDFRLNSTGVLQRHEPGACL